MEYCPHCMRPASGAICEHCGGDMNWAGEPGTLPVGTVLTGSGGLRTYTVGAARGKGGFGITYIALEMNTRARIAVKEYFPTVCGYRSSDSIQVRAKAGM